MSERVASLDARLATGRQLIAALRAERDACALRTRLCQLFPSEDDALRAWKAADPDV